MSPQDLITAKHSSNFFRSDIRSEMQKPLLPKRLGCGAGTQKRLTQSVRPSQTERKSAGSRHELFTTEGEEEMRVDNDVLAVLSAAQTRGNALIMAGQLDRNLYVRANKVLEAAGGKWNKKEKAHLFETQADERIDQIIISGEVEIPKDEYNFFPTPARVVDRLMEKAGNSAGFTVLEPSAGRGHIAAAYMNIGATVRCYELMEINYKALVDGGFSVTQADFLGVEPDPIYDRVVMNPPFMKRADIKHVLHALKFLKTGGLLVSVMSAGVKFREDKLAREFRDLVLEAGGEIEDVEDGAFKESGTMVKTVIVTIPAL